MVVSGPAEAYHQPGGSDQSYPREAAAIESCSSRYTSYIAAENIAAGEDTPERSDGSAAAGSTTAARVAAGTAVPYTGVAAGFATSLSAWAEVAAVAQGARSEWHCIRSPRQSVVVQEQG